LVINNANVHQTILRQFLDNFKQTSALIESQMQSNPELMASGWLENMGEFQNYIEQLYVNEASGNPIIVSYYTAIAMTALYGAMLSAAGISSIYAKSSKVGARVNLSPYPKIKLILADFIACTSIIVLSQTLLILYLHYVIGISFTNQLGAMALVIFLGSVLATSFGYLIMLFTKNEGFVTGVTMLWCFLAGMMGHQIKVAVENSVPYINYINPVALMTDSFQKLLFFEDFTMIIPYLVALLVWTVVCIVAASAILRRERYDSI